MVVLGGVSDRVAGWRGSAIQENMVRPQKEAWWPESSSGAKPSRVLTWLCCFPSWSRYLPVSFFLSAQDGLSELQNILFFLNNEDPISCSDKFLETQ